MAPLHPALEDRRAQWLARLGPDRKAVDQMVEAARAEQARVVAERSEVLADEAIAYAKARGLPHVEGFLVGAYIDGARAQLAPAPDSATAYQYQAWRGSAGEIVKAAQEDPEGAAWALVGLSEDKRRLQVDATSTAAVLAAIIETMDQQARAIAEDDDTTAERCWDDLFDLLEEAREMLCA